MKVDKTEARVPGQSQFRLDAVLRRFERMLRRYKHEQQCRPRESNPRHSA